MTLPPPGQPIRVPAEPVALFACGTLALPEVLRVLLGRVPDSTPVAAEGWRVTTIPGRVEPVIVAAEAIAHGQLITDLNGQEWRVIDAFEDHTHDLRRITLTDGRSAWAYVCPETGGVAAEDWDEEQLGRDELTAYLRRCAAWRHSHGNPPDR
jgi:hypothetical protein